MPGSRTMSRPAAAALAALLLVSVVSLAHAGGRVEFLAERLRLSLIHI